jgi:hypothetical protein
VAGGQVGDGDATDGFLEMGMKVGVTKRKFGSLLLT